MLNLWLWYFNFTFCFNFYIFISCFISSKLMRCGLTTSPHLMFALLVTHADGVWADRESWLLEAFLNILPFFFIYPNPKAMYKIIDFWGFFKTFTFLFPLRAVPKNTEYRVGFNFFVLPFFCPKAVSINTDFRGPLFF